MEYDPLLAAQERDRLRKYNNKLRAEVKRLSDKLEEVTNATTISVQPATVKIGIIKTGQLARLLGAQVPLQVIAIDGVKAVVVDEQQYEELKGAVKEESPA